MFNTYVFWPVVILAKSTIYLLYKLIIATKEVNSNYFHHHDKKGENKMQ